MTEVPRVLFVCTANRCRSPMAAALLDRRLRRRGITADVRSAGLLEEGTPSPAEVVLTMVDYGFDLSAHRSHRLGAEDVTSADLIIGLERQHVREAVLVSGSRAARGRAFTLRELVRRARAAGPRPASLTLDQELRELNRGRRPSELLGASPLDDVADPIGSGLANYRSAAATIDDLVGELVALLWPVGPESPETTTGIPAPIPTTLSPPRLTKPPGLT
jgi:protein-tyrosine-phosphatase